MTLRSEKVKSGVGLGRRKAREGERDGGENSTLCLGVVECGSGEKPSDAHT
jgi:hypothetical protein